MFSKEKVKRTIIEIINNPPTYEDMLADLRMHNVRVLHKSGDIASLPIVDKDVVERVWKSYKVNSVLEERVQLLKIVGIKSSVIYQNVRNYLKDLELDINGLAGNLVEDFFDNNYIEFEIYNPVRKTKN